MKLYWASDRKSIILIAETRAEVAFGEIVVDGMNAYQFAKIMKGSVVVGAQWAIIPSEPPEAGNSKE